MKRGRKWGHRGLDESVQSRRELSSSFRLEYFQFVRLFIYRSGQTTRVFAQATEMHQRKHAFNVKYRVNGYLLQLRSRVGPNRPQPSDWSRGRK